MGGPYLGRSEAGEQLLTPISCPVGYVDPVKGKGKGKVPVGLMAMGEWGGEDALLVWGRDAERWLNEEYADGRQRPANWVDVMEQGKKKM